MEQRQSSECMLYWRTTFLMSHYLIISVLSRFPEVVACVSRKQTVHRRRKPPRGGGLVLVVLSVCCSQHPCSSRADGDETLYVRSWVCAENPFPATNRTVQK